MSYTDAGFQNLQAWTPSFTPASGSITNVNIFYAKYCIIGKLCFYQFKAKMDVSTNTSYIKCTMPTNLDSVLDVGDAAMGIGVYNDGNYVSCYALSFNTGNEVYINKYDGTALSSGTAVLVTMEGKYEIA